MAKCDVHGIELRSRIEEYRGANGWDAHELEYCPVCENPDRDPEEFRTGTEGANE